MIRTGPGGEVVDPLEVQFAYSRPADGRPWVMANFVTTIDGATVVEGGSTAINDDDDKAMFQAIRAVADFILVGAGTLRAENYGPTGLDETRRNRREEAGLEPTPHLVTVSGSLDLDPGARVFSDPGNRVTVLTGIDADDSKRLPLQDVADVIQLEDLTAEGIAHYLRMAGVVLIEGGPGLFGQFVSAELVDEVCWTIAPVLYAGESPRMAHGKPVVPPTEMRLDNVFYGDRALFTRYVKV
jgi:riboflavin biosynthesis pyrimidine reductase